LTINERFKEIRLNLNKTQADFGEQCGLGRAVIANIENNRSPVTPLRWLLTISALMRSG